MKACGSFLFFQLFRADWQLQKFGSTCVQDHGWNAERLLTETPLCSKNTEGFWVVNGLMEDEENQVGEHLFSLPEAGETGRKNQFFFTRQSSRPGMREIFFSILSLSMFPSETVSARGNAFQ